MIAGRKSLESRIGSGGRKRRAESWFAANRKFMIHSWMLLVGMFSIMASIPFYFLLFTFTFLYFLYYTPRKKAPLDFCPNSTAGS